MDEDGVRELLSDIRILLRFMDLQGFSCAVAYQGKLPVLLPGVTVIV